MDPYPAYRPSGVEWLGDVPEHWQVKRLEQVASYRTSSVDKKAEEDEIPVRLCNYTDVYYKDRIRAGAGDFMEATASPREIARFGLRVGDVLVTKDSEDWRDIGVPALVEETASDFVCGYHLGIITAGEDLDYGFLFRLMQSGAVNQQLQTSASGVTRYGLPNSAVGDATLPLPPLDEQRAIAAFLDRETERIDTLVAKKRQLIERLQEYRTALITRTVTRGLPPDAARAAGLHPSPRLRPSGVEWLGDVPEHWEVKPLHTLTEPHRPIIYGIVLPGPHVDEGVPIVKGGDVRERVAAGLVSSNTTFELDESHARSRLVAGDLVFAIRGSVGDVAEVPAPLHGANITQDAARIAPLAEVHSTWLRQFLASNLAKDQVLANALGATISGINIRDLRRLLVPTPPKHEQERIATHLAVASARLDGLQDRAAIAIERLQEYRTALITATVTGKVDVRE